MGPLSPARRAGRFGVDTAASVPEALRLIEGRAPDVAVLEVNLGSSTSMAIADELTRRSVPFPFATGYGDTSSIADAAARRAGGAQAYDSASILGTLRRLLARA